MSNLLFSSHSMAHPPPTTPPAVSTPPAAIPSSPLAKRSTAPRFFTLLEPLAVIEKKEVSFPEFFFQVARSDRAGSLRAPSHGTNAIPKPTLTSPRLSSSLQSSNRDQEAKTALDLIWGHGWGQSGQSMMALSSHLCLRARHYFVDFPGFGQARLPSEPLTTQMYAQDLVAALEQQGLAGENKERRRVYIGHSFGGRIALELTAQFPDLFDGIVMIAPPGLLPWKQRWGRALSFLPSRLFSLLSPFLSEPQRELWRRRLGSRDYVQASHELRRTLVQVLKQDLRHLAKLHRAVSPPSLIIGGEDDQECPPAHLRLLASKMAPTTKLHLLPRLGHLQLLDRGAPLLAHIIEPWIEDQILDC